MAKTELTPKEAEATATRRVQVRLPRRLRAVLPHPAGLNEEIVREISAHKSEPEWMTDYRVKAYRHFVERELPQWGGDLSTIDFENIYYYLKPVENQARSWDDLPPGCGDVGQAGHPRGREEVPGRRRRPVRVRGRLPQPAEGSGRPGRHLPRHRQRPARARGPLPRVLRHGHPVQRQQVRGAQLGRVVGRLVHLRAAGSEGRAAAAGLLPHQRREHGPVRAHPDHRRPRRLRALRRGLHGADLLDRLAALGRGRDHRRARAAAAATRPSRTGRPTSTTSSPSGRSPSATPPWSGSTATSAPS